MTFHIITIFPETIRSYVDESILGRAQKKGLIKIKLYNPRDFTKDKHRRVDDKPYGGGPGMVMQAGPILRAVKKARGRKKNVKIVILSPSGKQFTNIYAKTLSKKHKDIILISGRYEGIDARVKKILRAEEISIGPFVLTGGEVPAMAVVDAVARQIPGVLGREASLEEKRIASSEMYTRPEVIAYRGKNYRAPKVLLSGDHKEIEGWRNGRR
ncbi:MAG: tRNA (guanosine(37)-N1)-methyltransferase TrmD [Patescibacteria group bacterium]|nr:MAG: tRNA (guanosine(37)-N1)-methyltransferase TrmD [Patescibacteria group bacterium]